MYQSPLNFICPEPNSKLDKCITQILYARNLNVFIFSIVTALVDIMDAFSVVMAVFVTAKDAVMKVLKKIHEISMLNIENLIKQK
jgi:uroporphyrinogen-III decarboxylase